MQEQRLTIEGMTCQHCVMSVRKALMKIPGLTVADVQIGAATVLGADTDSQRNKIREAVEEAGYRLKL